MERVAIIEIGSNNTKTHVYEDKNVIYDNTTTIEFKKNYYKINMVDENDLLRLYNVIEKALEYTENVHIYGCSIFRNISKEELDKINYVLYGKYNLEIEVVSQEEEALYTALGCYSNINYNGNICIFIGGGGSIELILVNNGNVIDKKYYDFGVVDITNKFESLKADIPTCTFDEVYNYVGSIVGDLNFKADVLILAGGNHFYWYNNAGYKLMENTLYKDDKQPYMLTINMSDEYDRDALVTSLDAIKKRSDNPLWFDGSRAMKVITNLISHKVNATYIVPTKINMEDGIRSSLDNNNTVQVEDLFDDYVDFDTFSKSDFRVVRILDCEAVVKSKKLLKFVLDDGSGVERVILSGIHAYYEPEDLIGKNVVAILNLPPRNMMGIDSSGMLLSAVYKENGKEKINLILVDDSIPAGAKLY